MKLGRLNHVGVATPDIEAAIAFWRDVMGATRITEPFDMPEQGVRVCFVDTPDANGLGGTQIELLAPLSDGSPVSAFLERNPLGGQHHLAFFRHFALGQIDGNPAQPLQRSLLAEARGHRAGAPADFPARPANSELDLERIRARRQLP